MSTNYLCSNNNDDEERDGGSERGARVSRGRERKTGIRKKQNTAKEDNQILRHAQTHTHIHMQALTLEHKSVCVCVCVCCV